MLDDRYDNTCPLRISVQPIFDRLGTPPEHKRLMLYDTDHYIPRAELIKETLAWLDKYLGSVSLKPAKQLQAAHVDPSQNAAPSSGHLAGS